MASSRTNAPSHPTTSRHPLHYKRDMIGIGDDVTCRFITITLSIAMIIKSNSEYEVSDKNYIGGEKNSKTGRRRFREVLIAHLTPLINRKVRVRVTSIDGMRRYYLS